MIKKSLLKILLSACLSIAATSASAVPQVTIGIYDSFDGSLINGEVTFDLIANTNTPVATNWYGGGTSFPNFDVYVESVSADSFTLLFNKYIEFTFPSDSEISVLDANGELADFTGASASITSTISWDANRVLFTTSEKSSSADGFTLTVNMTSTPPSDIPEPAMLALLGIGLVGFAVKRNTRSTL